MGVGVPAPAPYTGGLVVLGWVGAGCAIAKASIKGRVEGRMMIIGGAPLDKGGPLKHY